MGIEREWSIEKWLKEMEATSNKWCSIYLKRKMTIHVEKEFIFPFLQSINNSPVVIPRSGGILRHQHHTFLSVGSSNVANAFPWHIPHAISKVDLLIVLVNISSSLCNSTFPLMLTPMFVRFCDLRYIRLLLYPAVTSEISFVKYMWILPNENQVLLYTRRRHVFKQCPLTESIQTHLLFMYLRSGLNIFMNNSSKLSFVKFDLYLMLSKLKAKTHYRHAWLVGQSTEKLAWVSQVVFEGLVGKILQWRVIFSASPWPVTLQGIPAYMDTVVFHILEHSFSKLFTSTFQFAGHLPCPLS